MLERCRVNNDVRLDLFDYLHHSFGIADVRENQTVRIEESSTFDGHLRGV